MLQDGQDIVNNLRKIKRVLRERCERWTAQPLDMDAGLAQRSLQMISDIQLGSDASGSSVRLRLYQVLFDIQEARGRLHVNQVCLVFNLRLPLYLTHIHFQGFIKETRFPMRIIGEVLSRAHKAELTRPYGALVHVRFSTLLALIADLIATTAFTMFYVAT